MEWSEAVEEAKERLGYDPDEYVEDWDEIVEEAKEVLREDWEENRPTWCHICYSFHD